MTLQYDSLQGAWKSTNRQELERKKYQLMREGYKVGNINTSASIAYGPYYFFYQGAKMNRLGNTF